jgi:hypothetical protein
MQQTDGQNWAIIMMGIIILYIIIISEQNFR